MAALWLASGLGGAGATPVARRDGGRGRGRASRGPRPGLGAAGATVRARHGGGRPHRRAAAGARGEQQSSRSPTTPELGAALPPTLDGHGRR